MRIVAFCDGGYRSNKKSYYGSFKVFIFNDVELLVTEEKDFILPNAQTSNEAEYLSVLTTLAYINNKHKEINNVELFSDSRFVVMQVTGEWTAKKYKKIYDKIILLRNKFSDFSFSWISRKFIVRILGH